MKKEFVHDLFVRFAQAVDIFVRESSQPPPNVTDGAANAWTAKAKVAAEFCRLNLFNSLKNRLIRKIQPNENENENNDGDDDDDDNDY